MVKKLSEIVVTGYGLKAPGVEDANLFLDILKNGTCTQSIFKDANPSGGDLVAGIIENDFLEIDGIKYNRHPRAVRLAIASAKDAVNMANISTYDSQRVAVIMGTAAGAVLEIQQNAIAAFDIKTFPLHGVTLVDSHTLANSVAEAIGVNGLAFTITTGCTASLDAILLAKQLLESGTVDACIVGGADAPLGQWTINSFKKIRSLSTQAEMSKAGVPFSKDFNGFVLSEGAGIVVLERKQSAESRNQKIYGTIERVVSRNEGLKLLRSDTTGQHMLSVFQETVGNIKPSYVNSQALGMNVNDRIEQFILKETFGSDVPITSIKGMLGHSFGAMGVIQVIASLLSIEHSFIPPTIKTNGSGFEDTPIVYETTYKEVKSVVITSHGSSGNNTCLLLTHP